MKHEGSVFKIVTKRSDFCYGVGLRVEMMRRESVATVSYGSSIGGSVVEFSPATREARVRFPANAVSFFLSRYPHFKFFFFLFFFNSTSKVDLH